VYSDTLPILDDPYYMMTYARSVGEGTYRMQYSSFFYVPGTAEWDSSTSSGGTFTPTKPGWRFLSTIEVQAPDNGQWWMSSLYSFLEQWEGAEGLSLRRALYGPGFVAEEGGDFVQIKETIFNHGEIENYKHVNAFSGPSGSVGMEMGGTVTRTAFHGQVFDFPEASMPDELVSFLPIKMCLSGLPIEKFNETAEIESCLGAASTASTTPCNVKTVEVVSTTSQALNIVQVQVFSNGVDVALQGTASQSTTFRNNTNTYGAGNAIDNKTTTFSHTTSGVGQSWKVVLQNEVTIESVKITNRVVSTNADIACRLSGANLTLYDAAGNLVANMTLPDTCSSSVIEEEFASC
jgi:hypothetical protein